MIMTIISAISIILLISALLDLDFTLSIILICLLITIVAGYVILPGLFIIWIINTLFNYNIEYTFWSWGAFTFLIILIQSWFGKIMPLSKYDYSEFNFKK